MIITTSEFEEAAFDRESGTERIEYGTIDYECPNAESLAGVGLDYGRQSADSSE